MQTIYVRQKIAIPDLGGIFRSHFLQLQELSGNRYRIMNVLAPIEAKQPANLTSTRAASSDYQFPRTFRMTKGLDNHLLCSVVIERMGGPALIMMLGTQEGFTVGFDAIDVQDPGKFDFDDFETIRQIYEPKQS